MRYVPNREIGRLAEELALYAQLKSEHGAKGVSRVLSPAAKKMREALRELRGLPIDQALAQQEPDALASTRALCPAGPRRLWDGFNKSAYRDRLEGALLGRMAG